MYLDEREISCAHMEWLALFIDYFLHLDRHLGELIQNFGGLTYLILFLIIFCETGLVVTPILPGDSLLFGLGAFAANPYLKGPLENRMVIADPGYSGNTRRHG